MRLTGYCIQRSKEDTGHSPVGAREGAKEKEAGTGEKRCCWKDEPLLIEAKERGTAERGECSATTGTRQGVNIGKIEEVP